MKTYVWLAGAILLSGYAGSAMANQPYCREYTKQVSVGGRAQEGFGTACMQPDGSWAVNDEKPENNIQLANAQYYTSYSTGYVTAPTYYAPPPPPPVYYHPPYYRPPVASSFVFGLNIGNNDSWGGSRWRGNGWGGHGRGRGHWDDHGHGHGHGRGHGRGHGHHH